MAKAAVAQAEDNSATPEKVKRNHGQEFKEAAGDVAKQLEIIDDFVANVMRKGEDYGIIPGTNKPSLYKGGAEKLLGLLDATPRFEILEYIFDPDKVVTTLEWDNATKTKKPKESRVGLASFTFKCVLVDGDEKELGSGFGHCNSLEGKYAKQGAVNVANTALKMSKKRSLVDAILTATRISGQFTQDVEDMDLGGGSSGGGRKPSSDDFEL